MSKKNRAPSVTPPETPQQGQVQLFGIDPQVGVLVVHPIVVETLRARMGLTELEGKYRNLEGQLTVANTYISNLVERVTALEAKLATKQ